MTTSSELRTLAVQALTGATEAGANVFSPRDQASWDGEYPVLFVTIEQEDGDSFGRNAAPAFTVTATLRVEARAENFGMANDAGAALVLEQLETLREQIKAAVINQSDIMPLLQQFPFFRSHVVRGPADGEQHMASLVVDIGMEFVQGPEHFFQPTSTPLEGFDMTVQEPVGTVEPGFSITFPNPIS